MVVLARQNLVRAENLLYAEDSQCKLVGVWHVGVEGDRSRLLLSLRRWSVSVLYCRHLTQGSLVQQIGCEGVCVVKQRYYIAIA